MTPILGITASSITSSFLGGDYESIATVVASGSSAEVEFTSIPSTYQHLQIRYIARNTSTGTRPTLYFQVNNATSSGTYSIHYLTGNGTSASAAASTNANVMVTYNAWPELTSNVFGVGVIDILDYKDTNKNTTFRVLTGYDNNGSGTLSLISNLYMSTTAISSIKFFPDGPGNIASGSHFALYGIL